MRFYVINMYHKWADNFFDILRNFGVVAKEHFKDRHDGTGETKKTKVHQHVTAAKVAIKDAKHFAEYANQATNVKVEFLDRFEVITNDVSDAVEIMGNLKLHRRDNISLSQVEFYYNSKYKNNPILCSVNSDESESSSEEEEASFEEETSTCNIDSTSKVEEFHSSINDLVSFYWAR